nr:unnamed protein product [Spirometra erinaceieuropaei]
MGIWLVGWRRGYAIGGDDAGGVIRSAGARGVCEDSPRSNQPNEGRRYKVDIGALSQTRFTEQGQLEEVDVGYTVFCLRPQRYTASRLAALVCPPVGNGTARSTDLGQREKCVVLRNKEFNVVVPSGERFNVYRLPNLRLVGISDSLPSDIRAFTSDRFLIYAAADNIVYAFRGLRHVDFCLEGHKSPIVDILAFSDDFLASYDESGTLIVWNLQTRTQIKREEFPIDTFVVSAMLHPSSFKNKLLLGSLQGPLRLWNFATGRSIYWFKGFDAAVSCLTQSPAKDVCAIGLNDGRIILHNLRYDVSLVAVVQDGGAITSIEFRSVTAGLSASEALQAAGIQPMVEAEADIFLLAGSASGSLVSWKLESDSTCRAVNQTEELHLARVVSLFCIPTGAAAGAVVSCGADNNLKVSYFDRPDGGLRTAHVRGGHFLPPNQIAFWTGGSAGGNLLVSAGSDSQLRIFSTFNDRFDKNLVTNTWPLQYVLQLTLLPRPESDVLGLALSSGEIVLINVLNRQLFRRLPNAVNQLCVDLAMSSDGTLLVSAHRGDALIKIWDVVDCKLLDCFRVKKAVTSMAFSPSDDLLATTHVGSLGVYLWDNRATYQRLHLTPLPSDYVPPTEEEAIALPTRSLPSVRQLPGEGDEADEDVINLVDSSSDEEGEEEEMEVSGEQKTEARSCHLSPDQLQDKLVTLSGLPTSFFKAFLQLDSIKKRNSEAIAVADEAKLELPFFLPVIETTTGMAWIDEADDEEVAELTNASNALETARSASKRSKRRSKMSVDEIFESHHDSVLADLPAPGEDLTDQICDQTIARLKALNPSSLDMEIRLLAPAPDELAAAASAIDFIDQEGPLKRLCSFLALLVNRFKRNLDVDFATACLESVLRRHGEVIARPSHFLNSTTRSPGFDQAVVLETLPDQKQTATENLAFALVEEALKAKRSSQTMLFNQITRSIALVDFVRNASCALQM